MVQESGASEVCAGQGYIYAKGADVSTKYKPRAYGEESTLPVNRTTEDDSTRTKLNRKAYREREKKPCAFSGCITPVRYRSVYAPYCDLHGTAERRERA